MREEFCAPMLDSLTTATVLINCQQNVVAVNSSAEEMFNSSAARVIGQNVHNLLIDRTGNLPTLIESAFTNAQSYAERERRFKVPGGDEVTVDLVIIPTSFQNEDYVLLEVVTMDRSLRIMREELLQKEHQATRNMLRGLAHEIKNPLGGLRGAAQLLQSELDNSELREYTQIIVAEADRLHALVDRMLGPNMLPNKVPSNVHRIMQHVCGLVEAEGLANIKFHSDYDPSIPRLLLDRDMLIQAILNIVKNAVRAIGNQPGNITFKTRILRRFTIGQVQHKLVACISIIDDGPGIPKDIQAQVFFPMVSGQQQGSGLGLAISQMLIDQHGGLIEFDSHPGNTEFRVLLPLVDTAHNGITPKRMH